MSNGNGNGSSGDPTPASSAIALLPGMSVVSLPSPGCFDFSPYPGVWAPGCWSAPDTWATEPPPSPPQGG